MTKRPLSISNGNSITFDKWDSNTDDDFDGKYSSLTGAPKVYTQVEVDSYKSRNYAGNIATKLYFKMPTVVSMSSSRSVDNGDIGNTIACKSSSTLTIPYGLSGMPN